MDGRETAAAPTRAAASGLVLALSCAAQLMVVLDVSVINVALPSIKTDLGLGPAALPWVANAYLLAFGGFLLLGGRLADLYGCRRVFVAGLGLFTAASLLGGLAGDGAVLIAARAAQGIGAAVLAPVTLTLLTATFPEGPRRTRALAGWTAVSVAGGAAGNLLGGLLTEYLSWRATLLINVPLGLLALPVALRVLAAGAAAGRRRLDLPGALLATAGFAALSYGISRTESSGWTDPVTLGVLLGAALLLVVFLAVEARLGAAALLPLRLFANRAVSCGNAIMVLAGACFQASMWYFLTFYLQDELRFSPLQTGLGFLPHTLVTIAVGWLLTPWLMRRISGRTLVAVGALLAAAGFAWQSTSTPELGYLAGVLVPALVFSFGGGLLNTPLTTTVTSGVPAADAGAASALMNTAKQLGGALGLSVLLSVAGGAGLDYPAAFRICALILLVAAAATVLLPARRDGR